LQEEFTIYQLHRIRVADSNALSTDYQRMANRKEFMEPTYPTTLTGCNNKQLQQKGGDTMIEVLTIEIENDENQALECGSGCTPS
jgi:hypothetical protein